MLEWTKIQRKKTNKPSRRKKKKTHNRTNIKWQTKRFPCDQEEYTHIRIFVVKSLSIWLRISSNANPLLSLMKRTILDAILTDVISTIDIYSTMNIEYRMKCKLLCIWRSIFILQITFWEIWCWAEIVELGLCCHNLIS